MVEMLSYIFGSLKESENSIKAIKTTLRKQARINRTVAAFALVVAAYTIALEVHTYEQKRENKCDGRLSNDFNTQHKAWCNRNLSKVYH